MKIRAKVYKDIEGLLHQMGSGEAVAYTPVDKNGESYVSLNFGEIRIHLNTEDFSEFCKHFLNFSLYNKKGNKNALLRPNQ